MKSPMAPPGINEFDAGMSAVNGRGKSRRKRAEHHGCKQAGKNTDHYEAFTGSAAHMPANGAGMKYLAHS